jgi:hypothetical protein
VSAFKELIKPLSNYPGFAEARQLDLIDTLDLPPNVIHLLEVDPFILLRNIVALSGPGQTLSCTIECLVNREIHRIALGGIRPTKTCKYYFKVAERFGVLIRRELNALRLEPGIPINEYPYSDAHPRQFMHMERLNCLSKCKIESAIETRWVPHFVQIISHILKYVLNSFDFTYQPMPIIH